MDNPPVVRLEDIAQRDDFKRLSSLRNRLGFILAFSMALIYFAFIGTVAFSPASLAEPVRPGSAVSIGIVVGVAIMASGFLLTAIYVVFASVRLDPLVEKIRGGSDG
ncbi:DUF485 domain-containing protein [Brucella sp. NM4]|uniref:DUF485 domain-containing protein n=1 Tax=Brucella sp. NM4 TaxID=3045175 RepID=UPI0024BC676B|nr:DUF485 domain-containing protein [Brucella sp. NM4]WHS33897.1 DUF485 domain-containing protein [Brucella sp. NM4]